MSNLGTILFTVHVAYVTLIVSSFFILLLVMDDELHQYAMNKAIRSSVVLTILSLLGYALYMLVSGNSIISIHVLFFGIESLSLLTLLLCYCELKGFTFSFKIKNKKIINFIAMISTAISALTTVSMILQFKIFDNPKGFIRYDELILIINILLLSIIFGLLPNTKLKLNREAYRKQEKEIKKVANIFTVIALICMLLLIAYTIYRKAIL